MTQLKIGDKAPLFTGTDQDGKSISLSDFRGRKVILYFYPKDNTPGCTAEACSLRDGRVAANWRCGNRCESRQREVAPGLYRKTWT